MSANDAAPVWLDLFLDGEGFVSPPDPGNSANAPGMPNVQTGDWQFIDPVAYQGGGSQITDVPLIASNWQNWDQIGLNGFDASGLTGGGVSGGTDANIVDETALYFDTQTGIYYDLGDAS